MPQLPPGAANKLAKVCGLLGSDQDAERSAAAYQATRILKSHGMTWGDIIQPALPAPKPRYATQRPAHAAAVEFALRHAGHLTGWELQFVRDIGRRWRLSPKQAGVLDRIVAQLRQGGAA